MEEINFLTLQLAKKYTDEHGGGGGGTSNYNDLSNKPQIGGVTLSGNKSASDLGLVAAVDGKGLSTNDYTDADKAIVGGVTAALAGKQDELTAGNNIKIDNDTISVNRWFVPAGKVVYTIITSDENYGQNVHVQRHTLGGDFIDDRTFFCAMYTTVDIDGLISIYNPYSSFRITLLEDSDEQQAGYNYTVDPITTPTSNSFTFLMEQEENANDLIIRSELDAEVGAIKDGQSIDSFADVETALATKADLTDLAPAFSTSTAYTVGQYVSYDGNIYKCTSAHSAGAWVAGDFTLVAVGSELESKQNATDNSLQTTDKTVVGAVNELKSGLTNVQDDVKLNTQDLTTPSRTKNLLPLTLANLKARNTTGTWSGNVYTCPNVAFTVNTNDDGLVTSLSTTSSGSYSDTMALEFNLPKGTYILASGFNETSGTTDTLLFKDNVVIARGNSASPGQTFTLDSDSTVVWNIRATSSDITAYPMIRPATITDPTFAPYIPSVESRIEAVESGLTTLFSNILTAESFQGSSEVKYVVLGKVVVFYANITKNQSSWTIAYGLPKPYFSEAVVGYLEDNFAPADPVFIYKDTGDGRLQVRSSSTSITGKRLYGVYLAE